mmetsp:Transcript_20707/g.46961  ORF Transcript_20707/g.46961 Transcript_20707/m.46961 type:complete len:356 (-) Transcript_20707:291-1358(-)
MHIDHQNHKQYCHRFVLPKQKSVSSNRGFTVHTIENNTDSRCLRWIRLGHIVHPQLALVEPSPREILCTVLRPFRVRKGGVYLSSRLQVHYLSVLDRSKLGTLVEEFLLDFDFPAGIGLLVLVVHVVDEQVACGSAAGVSNKARFGCCCCSCHRSGGGGCRQLPGCHVCGQAGSSFRHRRAHSRPRSGTTKSHASSRLRHGGNCWNRRSSNGRTSIRQQPHRLVEFLFCHGRHRRTRQVRGNDRRLQLGWYHRGSTRHSNQDGKSLSSQFRSVIRKVVRGHDCGSRGDARRRLHVLVRPSHFEGPTTQDFPGHGPDGKVGDLGVAKGQKCVAPADVRVGMVLKLNFSKGSELRKE